MTIELDALTRRLNTLERTNRRYRALLTITFGALAAILLSAAVSSAPHGELVCRDPNNGIRAQLGANGQQLELSSMALHDTRGLQRVADDGRSSFVIRDANDKTRIDMGVAATGETFLIVTDRNGNARNLAF
jgi:hypothetical protein